ncbi:hypothetical protein E1286_05500 [Nonomuraea terrae]|uniref:Uncharacterized protein n=1 Tax=Nonomuraea terrae TaxID=2530383 RepID=A0A4R4Z8U7_9ACTN|nr:hypothetical protein [Nonomuraea terrae]TDD54643.1 hypothetical protein E1286_05500 [Nonomuraea terrae]
MIRTLHKMGIRAEHAYAAGIASIGLTVASWAASWFTENTARADRWGIFVGEWAPTFFALGLALRMEETHQAPGEEEVGPQRERLGQYADVRR